MTTSSRRPPHRDGGDIDAFVELSGDRNQLQTDDCARSVGFAGRIAHGVLVLSIESGLSSTFYPGTRSDLCPR
jgi:acyl dehydratase